MTGVGVTPSSRWMMVSTLLAASTSSAVRSAGPGHRVGVLAHVERAVGALAAPVVADSLGDGQDMRLGERAVQRRAPVPAGAEADQLVRIFHVGAALVVLPFELGQIDQHLLWGRFAGEGEIAMELYSLRKWNNGNLEHWNNGRSEQQSLNQSVQYSNIPSFQFSPFHHSIIPIIQTAYSPDTLFRPLVTRPSPPCLTPDTRNLKSISNKTVASFARRRYGIGHGFNLPDVSGILGDGAVAGELSRSPPHLRSLCAPRRPGQHTARAAAGPPRDRT